MWKELALGLGVALAVSTGAFADDAAPPPATTEAAPTDAHLAAAVDLLDAQNAKANMKSMMDTFMSMATNAFHQGHPDIPNDKLKLFTEAFAEEMSNSTDGLLKMQAKVYAEHFSEDELHGLAAFYRSDLGRKCTAQLPLIAKETVPLAFQWGQTIAPVAMQHAVDKLKKEGVKL